MGTTVPEAPPDHPADRVERLRESLPPPVVRGTGQQTRGRWIAPNGRDYPIGSGVDSRSELVNEQLTVVINNTPRKGEYNCDTLVPILLPEGCTLTVYGITPRGTRTRVRYTGGAEPWWR